MALDLVKQARKIIERGEEIESELANPDVLSNRSAFADLNRRRKALEDTVEAARKYLALQDEISEWETALKDSDSEMREMAETELPKLQEKKEGLAETFRVLLVPKDPNDVRNCILEIRAGTGGDEASLFAGDLFRMYRLYAEGRGWKVGVLSVSEGTMGGYKEVICSVTGEGCYGDLKHESGVHRVQRVPTTEASGRVHTSAASVAVLPEVDEMDEEIEIPEQDMRIDTYRSSGAGGQHVNTTDSAIRITHLPTGVVVTCQDERSQMKNKSKALKFLKSKLLDMQIAEQEKAEAANRKSQVGTGDRSAKIRTYNFPQGRVTDHRINLTLYKLDSVIKGDLEEIVNGLSVAVNQEKLQELEKTG